MKVDLNTILAILDNLRFVATKYGNEIDPRFLEIETFVKFIRYQFTRQPELLNVDGRELYPTIRRGETVFTHETCYLKRVERKPAAPRPEYTAKKDTRPGADTIPF